MIAALLKQWNGLKNCHIFIAFYPNMGIKRKVPMTVFKVFINVDMYEIF